MTSNSHATVEYLSDSEELISYVHQGWGQLGIDTCAHAPGQTPLPLQIKDTPYSKGLGHHAPGEIIVELEGLYDVFEAEVGVQWQSGNIGSVVSQVFVDDDKRFDSGVMREKDAAKPVRVDVRGAQELRLVVTDAGDGITCDCADWAEARLTRSAEPTTVTEYSHINIAFFGRTCAWDPNRTDGCRANRIQEFHAEDLFLESDVEPNADGTYTVPTFANGLGCIGHQWIERRRLTILEVQFADGTAIPPANEVRVEAWGGESLWQGNWKPLAGTMTQSPNKLTFNLDRKANPEIRSGYWKVRWILPASDKPYVVHQPIALKPVRWQTFECILQLEKPMPGRRGQIEMYNALLSEGHRCEWDLASPTHLKISYGKQRTGEADRAVIRISLPPERVQSGVQPPHSKAFGIAVDDLLANKCVYVPEAGLFATTDPKLTLADYKRRIAGRKTVLERVREMPDQTFEQAMAKTHNPAQNNGPTMLSLACDNRKFLVQQDGTVQFSSVMGKEWWAELPIKYMCAMRPKLGIGDLGRPERHLEGGHTGPPLPGGWLPILVSSLREKGITYRQRTFVAPVGAQVGDLPWYNDKPLFVSEFEIENSGSEAGDVSLRLDFLADSEKNQPADLRMSEDGVAVTSEGKLLAFIKLEPDLSDRSDGGVFSVSGSLPGKGRARVTVYIPGWQAEQQEPASLPPVSELIPKVEAYWNAVLAPAMQIQVPDPLLMDAIRASQVHCLIAARNDDDGETVSPWIASMSYGPLESEANSIVRGMGCMGHLEFTRRSLDFFIKRYSPEGFLTTGYTLMGTGWHLWSLGEYYGLTRDKAWMERVAPDVQRVCDWIVRQQAKTKKLAPRAVKLPEYGLMPPGVMADWNAFNYHFCLNGYYYAGLKHAAQILADIGDPKANSLLDEAEEFRNEILRAYRWTQARAPVFPLQDGTWVKEYPGRLHCPGPTGDFYPGEDGNRSWCYDVELGAHQLVPQGLLDPKSREVAEMMDHMEDVQFLAEGLRDYPTERSHADWFNLGGFAKVQPYYCRNAEVYALRDDVKPFIRSYFNALVSLLNTENMSLWEHFHTSGAFNKTHETGYFLHQTRTMLVQERGNDLWLAPFVTDNWLKDGKVVEVRNAPTSFGPVSYRIESQVSRGRILATIEPPRRNPPASVVLRLRHPDGRRMKSVKVNGAEHKGFDAAAETIALKSNASDRLDVVAEY